MCLEDSKQKKANNLLRFNLVEKRKWWKVERGHNSSHRCFFVTLMRVDFFYGLKDRARPIRYLDGRQLKGNSLGKRKNETFSPNRIIGSLGRWDLTCCVRWNTPESDPRNTLTIQGENHISLVSTKEAKNICSHKTCSQCL